MCKQWGKEKGRDGGGEGGKEGGRKEEREGREGGMKKGREGWKEERPQINISQSKPLKYKNKEAMFFSELERNYESKYISR